MFPTERISRNNDDPRAATSKTASGRLMGSIPCPVFRQSCTRGLGRAPCTVFQLTWLNGIALAHSFHPSTRCERLASPLFFSSSPLPPLCPRDPKSPLEAAWYQVLTSHSRICRFSWDLLADRLSNRDCLSAAFDRMLLHYLRIFALYSEFRMFKEDIRRGISTYFYDYRALTRNAFEKRLAFTDTYFATTRLYTNMQLDLSNVVVFNLIQQNGSRTIR